jgi:hypothetical protein
MPGLKTPQVLDLLLKKSEMDVGREFLLKTSGTSSNFKKPPLARNREKYTSQNSIMSFLDGDDSPMSKRSRHNSDFTPNETLLSKKFFS